MRTSMSLITTIFMASMSHKWLIYRFTLRTELYRIYNFSPSIFLQRYTDHFAMTTNMMASPILIISTLKAFDSEVTVKVQCRKNTTLQKVTGWSNSLTYSTPFQQKNVNYSRVECRVVFWRQTWRVIWAISNLSRPLLKRTKRARSIIRKWY